MHSHIKLFWVVVKMLFWLTKRKFSFCRMINANELVCLYTSALDPRTVNNATEALEDIYDKSESVFLHFLVLQNSNVNVVIKKYVSIALRRLVKIHFAVFSENEITMMKDITLNLIQNEDNLQIKYLLCDIAIKLFFLINKENEEWNELIIFCRDILLTQNNKCFGFYIIKKVFDYIADINLKMKLLFDLINCIEEIIFDENCNKETRIQSLKLFKKLIDYYPENNSELSQMFIKLAGLIVQMVDQSIFQKEEEEVIVIVSSLCNLIENNWFIESGLALNMFNNTIDLINNNNNKNDTKIMLFNIIECSTFLITNNFPEQIPFLLKICIDLSVKICKLNNDDNLYEFGFGFFCEIAGSGINGVFDLLLNFILELFQTDKIPETLVGLFVLYSIIEYSRYAISTKLNQILQLIFLCCNNNNNDIIFSSACRVISEMIDFMSSDLTPFIDDISYFLLHNISHSDSLTTLDKLFYQCDKPPSSFNEIVCLFSSLIQNSTNIQAQQIISCLSSLLPQLNDSAEKLIIDLFPILNNLLNNRIALHGKILDFFGLVAKTVPNLIKNELNNLINLGIDSLTLDDDYFTNASIADCFGNLINVLPSSMSYYLDQIVPPLIVILQEDFDDLLDFQKEQLIISKSSSMVSLSKFIGCLPNEMEDYACSPILDYIIEEGIDLFCVKACEGIGFSCEGYFRLKVPFDEVLIILFDNILDIDDKNSISAILMTSGEIFSIYNTNFQAETINRIIYIIVQIFKDPPDSFLKNSHNKTIDDTILPSLFYCINALIDGLGESFSNYLEQFYQVIEAFICDESLLMRNNIILMSSHICFTCKIKNALYKMAINSTFNGILHADQREIKILLGKSIKFLILINKEYFKDRIDMIVHFSRSLYDDYQYYCLVCILAVSYHQIQFEEKFLIDFIENLSPPSDSEDIAYVGEFMYYIYQKSPNLVQNKITTIALRLFSSSMRHIDMLSSETRDFYINLLSNYNSNEILMLCKGNELNARKIISNLL